MINTVGYGNDVVPREHLLGNFFMGLRDSGYYSRVVNSQLGHV